MTLESAHPTQRTAVAATFAGVVVLAVFAVAGLVVFVVLAPESTAIVAADGVDVSGGLARLGIPLGAYIAFRVMLELVLLATSVVAAALVLARRPPSTLACIVALVLVATPAVTGVGAVALSVALTGSNALQLRFGFAVVGAYVVIAYLFPDGSFVPRWTVWAAVAWAPLVVWGFAGPWWDEGPIADAVASAAVAVLVVVAAYAQITRYRTAAPAARRQTMWIATALVVRIAYLVVILLLPLVIGPLSALPPAAGFWLFVAMTTFSYLLAAATAIAIAAAVVRYRLFDADVWLSRSVAYAALVVAILIVYVVVVGLVGLAWPSGDIVLAVAATAIAALALHPLRLLLVRTANRLVFGRRDDPATVLARLGERLADAETPDAMLRRLVDTVVTELRLRRAAVETREHDGAQRIAAASGEDDAEGTVEAFALRFGGEDLGCIVVVASDDSPLRPADRRLLSDIATNAATVVHLGRTDEELRRSREAVIDAHESERRLLGRELHDGLGPTIASLHLRVDTAISMIARDPDRSAALLDGTRTELVELIGEIRRIVAGLRPPGLDDVGLVAALSIAIEAGAGDGLGVRLDAEELPDLPADVELAAYRIVGEAVTNVRRHASGADVCTVRLHSDGSSLHLRVTDDGAGIPPGAASGVGLGSMRERAEEIGGTLTVTSTDGGGTCVEANLPFQRVPV